MLTLALLIFGRKGKKGRTYESPRIYLPTRLTSDSAFPFRGKIVRVRVKVEGRRLVVETASKKDLERYGEKPIKKRRRRKRR